MAKKRKQSSKIAQSNSILTGTGMIKKARDLLIGNEVSVPVMDDFIARANKGQTTDSNNP